MSRHLSPGPMTGNVGERTLGVAELAEGHVVGLITCEGGEDVVGVVTPLVRGGAQVFCMVIR